MSSFLAGAEMMTFFTDPRIPIRIVEETANSVLAERNRAFERLFTPVDDATLVTESWEFLPDGEVFFELSLHDAWVWDMYRPARFVSSVRVVTFKDVNVEELPGKDI